MKKSIKWLSAIALLIMGAFMFVSCGDDEDEIGKVASKSQIVGTWIVQSVRGEGPRVGSVIIFNSDGSAYAEGQQGSFTYDPNTGAFTFQMQGMSVTGTITISNSQLTVNYTTGEGETGTMVLSKSNNQDDITNGNDSIPSNPNDSVPSNPNDSIPSNPNDSTSGNEGGLIQGGDVKATEVVGTWLIAQCSDQNLDADSITFTKEGTGRMGNLTFTYSNEWQDNRIKCYIRFSNNVYTVCKFAVVQNGNVLNGECQDNGGDWEMLVLQKPGYSIPSEGILGRWVITGPRELDNMDEGPKVGMVLVFGQNGELYVEGDPHVGSYRWTSSSKQLYISMIDETGTLNYSGNLAYGTQAVWSLGQEMSVQLRKL